MSHHIRCAGPVNRRDFLHIGSLALGGLTLPQVLRGREAAGDSTDTAVILLFLTGGPSHLETYDLKPDAPETYRSIYKPIATRVPGMQICELFPLQARLADKISLVRSLHHKMTAHNDGNIEVRTGKTPTRPDPTSTALSEHPDFGNITSKVRGDHPDGLPRYVTIPGGQAPTRPNYLGTQHTSFSVSNPAAPTLGLRLNRALTPGRLDELHGLRAQFDGLRRQLDSSAASNDRFQEQARRLLTGTTAAEAFDVRRESDRLRERYGDNLWGHSCLLARRLAESGVAVTTVFLDTPRTGQEFTNWDDHILNAMRPGHFGKYMSIRLPYLDQAVSALIEDIYTRGLDRRILVVMMGEFGRTPRLSQNAQGVGRDHWPDAYTVLLSGGGLRMGQVVGATNSKGEFPTERPYTPKDLLATIYRHLGVDYREAFLDPTGRPIHILSESQPIAELI